MTTGSAGKRYIGMGLLLADIVALELSLLIAYVIRYSVIGPESGPPAVRLSAYAAAATLVMGIWILVFTYMRLGELTDGWRVSNIYSQLVVAWVLAGVVFLSALYMSKFLYSRLLLVCWAVLSLTGLALVRAGFRWAMPLWRRFLGRRILLVGSAELVNEALEKIHSHPEMLCELVGALCPGSEIPALASRAVAGVESWNLAERSDWPERMKVDEILVLLNAPPGRELLNFLYACNERNISIKMLPQPYELYVSKIRLSDFGGLPLVEVTNGDPPVMALQMKRAFDLCVGGILLIALSPIMLLIALLIHWKGKRHPLIRQLRVGHGGEPFNMYSYNVDRTLSASARWEKWLVKYSLTELPQLLNVFRGDMHLVGPRPETMERYQHYSQWHRRRLLLRPGVAGLAQVHGLREHSSTDEKVRYDLQYISGWSLLRDVVLLVETVWTLLSRIGEPDAGKNLPPLTAAPSEASSSVVAHQRLDS